MRGNHRRGDRRRSRVTTEFACHEHLGNHRVAGTAPFLGDAETEPPQAGHVPPALGGDAGIGRTLAVGPRPQPRQGQLRGEEAGDAVDDLLLLFGG